MENYNFGLEKGLQKIRNFIIEKKWEPCAV